MRTAVGSESRDALLRDEKALLEGILEQTHRQAEFLKAEDIRGFRLSLSKRRALITKVDELRPKLAANGIRPDGAMKEILLRVKALDESNLKELERQMSALSEEIKKLSEGQKALEGYRQGSPYASSELFDAKF